MCVNFHKLVKYFEILYKVSSEATLLQRYLVLYSCQLL